MKDNLKKNAIISVIVPVYNTEPFLRKCVDSILGQTFPRLEIILVDDGSTDESGTICDQYADRDERVRVIHQANSGLVEAWITGLESSVGEFIGFVDSDDWIDKNMYALMYEAMEANRADMVQCDYRLGHSGSTRGVCGIDRQYIFAGPEIERSLLPRFLTYWEARGMIFANSRCNKLIKRRLIEDNLVYCDKGIEFGEDLNLMLPVVLDSERIVCIPHICYNYKYNPDSITRTPCKPGLWKQVRRLMNRVDGILAKKKAKIDTLRSKLYGYLTIKSITNEFDCPDGMRHSLRNIAGICRHPRADTVLSLRFGTLELKSKFAYLCFRCMRPFLSRQ